MEVGMNDCSRRVRSRVPRPAARSWPRGSLLACLLALGVSQEAGECRGIEVEHLRAGKLPVADTIEAEHLTVEAPAGGAEPSLAPQRHDLLVAGCDDAHVHPSLGRGRLQRSPRPSPGGTILAGGGLQVTIGSAVGQ